MLALKSMFCQASAFGRLLHLQVLQHRMSKVNQDQSAGKNSLAEELQAQVNSLQQQIRCDVCQERKKDTILLKCKHLFCKQCILQTWNSRNRKCPACATKIGARSEIVEVVL